MADVRELLRQAYAARAGPSREDVVLRTLEALAERVERLEARESAHGLPPILAGKAAANPPTLCTCALTAGSVTGSVPLCPVHARFMSGPLVPPPPAAPTACREDCVGTHAGTDRRETRSEHLRGQRDSCLGRGWTCDGTGPAHRAPVAVPVAAPAPAFALQYDERMALTGVLAGNYGGHGPMILARALRRACEALGVPL